MTLLEETPRETPPLPDDPEALIREARGRQGRRRRRGLALLIGLLAVAGLAYGVVRVRATSAPAVIRVPRGPVVAVRAFAQQGRLAFISRGQLWLLDGRRMTLRTLPGPGRGFKPWQPMFSPDGKWLAYLEQKQNESKLWIARADGSDPRVVPALDAYALYGWSPTQDTLAVAAGPERTHRPCPCSSPTTLRLVEPDLSSRVVARAGWVYGAIWSPDGRRVGLAAVGENRARLISVRTDGSGERIWLSRRGRQRLNGMDAILFTPAGWWRRFGLAVWVFGDGAVHNLDETPLDAVTVPGATPTLLGNALSDGTTDAAAASRRGDVAIVDDHGGGREAWHAKSIVLCTSPKLPCRPLPHPPGTVTVDPAWSSDGRTLAYVVAPNVETGPWTQARVAAWFNAHRVVLYDATTARSRALSAADGATALTWSRDGTSLLYVKGDAVWMLERLRGAPVRIAAPLFPPHHWPQYYTQIAWSAQFAWSKG